MGRNMYQLAIDSQSACNLSRLFYSLPKIAYEIWKEIRADGSLGSTQAFQNHPVARLLAEQIGYLTSAVNWNMAMDICEEKAKDDIPADPVDHEPTPPRIDGHIPAYIPLPHPLEDANGDDIRRLR